MDAITLVDKAKPFMETVDASIEIVRKDLWSSEVTSNVGWSITEYLRTWFRLWQGMGKQSEKDSRMTLRTLYHIHLTICKAVSPFTPFLLNPCIKIQLKFLILEQQINGVFINYFGFNGIAGDFRKRMIYGLVWK